MRGGSQILRRVLLAQTPPVSAGGAPERAFDLTPVVEYWLFLKPLLFPLSSDGEQVSG